MDSVLEPRDLNLQLQGVPNVDGFLYTIPHCVSEEECKRIIYEAEQKGFVAASLYTDKDGVEHFSDRRKSYRCIIDSFPFAAELWRRIKPFVPPTLPGGWQVVGLNERLRILRYKEADEFKVHTDGTYIGPDGTEQSRITVLIYLNTGYEGAFTTFLNKEGGWTGIVPEVGMVAMQDQGLLHCVPPMQKGVKYVLRTEVMYKLPLTGPVKVVKIT